MAARSTTLNALVQNQTGPRLVLLGTLSVSTSAADFSLPPWSLEQVQADVGVLTNIDVPLGALLWLSATVDCNVRLTPQGSVAGSGTVTYSSASGPQSITVLGRQVSFSAGASDTATGDIAVLVLMQDALIGKHYTASNNAGVVTILARVKGTGYNGTITVTGTGASKTNITGGTDTAAATTATNSFIVPAKVPFPIYKLAGDTCLDVLGSASGVLNVFVGA